MEEFQPLKAKLEGFFDYFVNTWFEGSIEYSQWNHSQTEGPRTNNHCEGFHNKINRWNEQSHPNIYSLITLLKVVDCNTEKNFNARLTGTPAPELSASLIEKNRVIELNLQRLEDGLITLDQFIEYSRLLINFKPANSLLI